MDRLNVLQLVGSFGQGGSERQAVQLARLLRESGRFRVHVAVLDPAGPLRAEVERLRLEDPVTEYPLHSFYDSNAARQLRRFAAHLRARSIRAVQTHDFYSNVFGMAGASLARVPARVAAKRETTGMRTPAQKIVQRGAFALADAVVVNAEAVRADLVRGGVPSRKIVTIYNGLDLRRVTPPAGLSREDALRAFDLPTGKDLRFVTIVANLRHDVKDHPTFLRAARRVSERVPGARFVLAGEGELIEPMRALAASLGLADSVFFTGRCERVAELLRASDVCVLSSKAEGFSNSILEYMAAARPVVVTDVGGAREAVTDGETGYVVPAGDDAAMADRIVSLLKDGDGARAMGERGRRVVAEKFSCEAQLRRTVELYERLLGRASDASEAGAPAEQSAGRADGVL
ncbi:MAG: glycosyltransferase [Acidobacteria bacterium]|nr:glycosyltransferase [Acidobacteriota bacterium]MCA1641894.1 glycosyltransferase [Acidobacteriota bacterium]